MINNTPNLDPANNYTLVGVLQTALNNFQQAMQGMLPAQVVNYDRTSNRVSVQLMVNVIMTNGQSIERALLSSIPVMIMGCGAFSISFPVKTGDFGWVLANDRDISTFLQNIQQNYTDSSAPPKQTTNPNTTRMNNFGDSVFIPDTMKTFNANNIPDGYVSIQSNDPLHKFSIQFGLNTTTTPNSYEVNIVADRINLGLNDTLLGLVTIDGNLDVSGTISSGLPAAVGPVAPAVPFIMFPPVYPP